MAVALSINPCWLLEVKTPPLIYNSQWTQRPLKRCKFGLFVEREVHEPGDGPPTLSASNNTLHGRGSQIRGGGAFNWGKVTDLFITSLRHPLEPSLMLHNWMLHISKVPVDWTAVFVAWKHWEAAFVTWIFGMLLSNSVRLPCMFKVTSGCNPMTTIHVGNVHFWKPRIMLHLYVSLGSILSLYVVKTLCSWSG